MRRWEWGAESDLRRARPPVAPRGGAIHPPCLPTVRCPRGARLRRAPRHRGRVQPRRRQSQRRGAARRLRRLSDARLCVRDRDRPADATSRALRRPTTFRGAPRGGRRDRLGSGYGRPDHRSVTAREKRRVAPNLSTKGSTKRKCPRRGAGGAASLHTGGTRHVQSACHETLAGNTRGTDASRASLKGTDTRLCTTAHGETTRQRSLARPCSRTTVAPRVRATWDRAVEGATSAWPACESAEPNTPSTHAAVRDRRSRARAP